MESENFDLLAFLEAVRDGQAYYRLGDQPDGSVEIHVSAGEPDGSPAADDVTHDREWGRRQVRVAG